MVEMCMSLGLGYFIPFEIWEDAINLVDYQIDQKSKNKFYNTLDNIYYNKVKVKYEPIIKTKDYFECKISNNLFYGLEKEFFSFAYSKPKASYGVRKYTFFSYPLRLIHFSIGLYLYQVTGNFLDQYIKEIKHIKSFYGGNLRYDKDELVLKRRNLYFLDHYREFKKTINNELSNLDNKIVLHIDIENYFDHLSIQRLLEFIDEKVSHSSKVEYRYDNYTMDQISFFYRYLMKESRGIPQSGTDIISGFLGYLYLVFADLQIDDHITQNNDNLLVDFKITRYVDDIYIVLNFKETTIEEKRKAFSINLLSHISDLLYDNFGLRVNNKTKLFLLKTEEQKKELVKNLKKVSSDLPVTNDDFGEVMTGPQDKLIHIFSTLKKLKEISLDVLFYDEKGEDGLGSELFKEIYNIQVNNIINKKENIEELKVIFSDFNFDLIKVKPSEILQIILKEESTKADLINFML